VRRTLAQDHDVDALTRAADALAKLRSGADYDVILCDLMMPEMSGMELYERVRARWPAITPRFVFLSGGASSRQAGAFRASVPNLFLDKPCKPELLRGIVGGRVRSLRATAGINEPA